MTKKLNNANGLSIGYSGDIKLTTYIGNKYISSKTYHNRGALALYRFLANCLSGNFPAAYHLRPFKIKLLRFTDTENVQPTDFDITEQYQKDKIIDASDYIQLASAPEIRYVDTKDSCGCSVVFNFIFPYDRIIGTEAHIVAIYGPNISDSDEFCAYYCLTANVPVGPEEEVEDAIENPEQTTSEATIIQWDPIIKDEFDEETNKILAVEWTMNLANRNAK